MEVRIWDSLVGDNKLSTPIRSGLSSTVWSKFTECSERTDAGCSLYCPPNLAEYNDKSGDFNELYAGDFKFSSTLPFLEPSNSIVAFCWEDELPGTRCPSNRRVPPLGDVVRTNELETSDFFADPNESCTPISSLWRANSSGLYKSAPFLQSTHRQREVHGTRP